VALWQFDAVRRDHDLLEQASIETHLRFVLAISFLYQVLLRLAFSAVLFFFSLFYLFHQVTFAVAMQPGPGAVLAKFAGNIAPVHFETCVDKKARKTAADNSEGE